MTFSGCTFEDNITSEIAAGATPIHRLDPYIGYGGGVCAENSSVVVFADCNFVDNAADTGGAMYIADSNAAVIDCNVASNEALRGAGFGGVGGLIDVAGSTFRYNQAITDVNDPNDDEILPLGGGLFCWSTDAQIQDCNIFNNFADGSGGGIYLRGENATVIANCLLRSNLASRDGGGLSTNWYARPLIRNCTFFRNSARDITNDPNLAGIGGGVYCGYGSECEIIDSILWQNDAYLGAALTVGSGFRLDRQCGKITVSYSDIMDGPNDIYVEEGCTLEYGEGVIDKDPLFVRGPWGDFYLAHRGLRADQTRTSPCVDAGSDLASKVGMSRYTTRTDRLPDTGTVDMGYHYRFVEPCRFCDLVFDGIIRFDDFAMFALKWLEEGCSEADGWCGGADFTFDSRVDARDLAALAECWLVEDTTPPVPNPSEWEREPYMASRNAAQMIAKEAVDGWGWAVEYYFECARGDCHDSGWTPDRQYIDWPLAPGVEYGYRVKARDALGNETKFSEIRFAGERDTVPPVPEPYIQAITATSWDTITMTASVSYDKNGVQYYFQVDEVNTPGGHDSGWIDTTTYVDVNLVQDTVYSYRVKARDLSAGLNETGWSEWRSVRTLIPPERDPPEPNPMQFDPNGLPREVQAGPLDWDVWAEMTADIATDVTPPIQYYFECEDPRYDSGWIGVPSYSVQIGNKNRGFEFRVYARDGYGNVTQPSDWVKAIQRPGQPLLPTTPGGTPAGGAGAGVLPAAGAGAGVAPAAGVAP